MQGEEKKTEMKKLNFVKFNQTNPAEGNPEAFWDFVFNGVLQKETRKIDLNSRKTHAYNGINFISASQGTI